MNKEAVISHNVGNIRQLNPEEYSDSIMHNLEHYESAKGEL